MIFSIIIKKIKIKQYQTTILTIETIINRDVYKNKIVVVVLVVNINRG